MSNFKMKSHKDEVLDELDSKIEIALEEIGLEAEKYAKMKCPVDTGRLRNSISHLVSGQGQKTVKYKAMEYYTTKAGKKSKRRKSVDYSYKTGNASGDNSNSVYIGTNVEYAPYVEFGTSKQKPQPYLKPAVTDHVDEYKRIVKSILKED